MVPLIALLTDFGLRDHYVGTMKGVMLDVCPEATVVDLTHEVEPGDVLGASLTLQAAYGYFPRGTIFLVVVDPGVGSGRRAVAVQAGGYRFVAPDNGVLTTVLEAHPAHTAVALTETYQRAEVSRTFEGRDRFAPAAAWLARGVRLDALGPPVSALVRLDLPRPRCSPGAVTGCVIHVDRFGNLVTNVDRAALAIAAQPGETVTVSVGGQVIRRVVATYADVSEGELCALIGSRGLLEISERRGSAAERLGVGRNAVVVISTHGR